MASAEASAFGPVMRQVETGDVVLILAYDSPIGYDYPTDYDQQTVNLGTATTRPASVPEVSMAGTAGGPSMSPVAASTATASLTYEASVGYDYPVDYDAGAYVPAVATMSPA